MKKGFSLIELLIYVSIFAIAGGMMFGILALILKVNQRESSTGEITSQLNFVSQTLSRLIRSSSNVEIDASIATSTLKLRMKDYDKDPTCIYLDDVNGIIKLAEGPDTPLNLQNCTPNASDLTDDKIKVDKLEFIKSTQYPGHDSVSMNIQMSYNSPNPGAQTTREIKSASMRFSTAEFSNNIFPSNDALYDIGTSTARWRNAALSGNLLVAANVAIGTTTISEKLTVVDGNISQLPPLSSQKIGGVDLGADVNGISVSGRYAYTVDKDDAGNEFKTFDISNPASPQYVGGVDLGVWGEDIFISGRYAYLVKDDLGSFTEDFLIFDVSNPSSPQKVGGVNLGIQGYRVFVSGRYAYVTKENGGNFPEDFLIFDVSNPSSPQKVGGVNLGTMGYGIFVSGRYAYVTKDNAESVFPEDFLIFDVSNPSSPQKIGGVNLNVWGADVYVSGRYAYISTANISGNTCPAQCEFKIYDVSDPTFPVLVSSADLGNTGYGIYISGRYAYVVTRNVTGNEFKIYDVSDPNSPILIGGDNLGASGIDIIVSGRYAYVVHNNISGSSCPNQCEFKIYDISGLESVSANIHSLEAGNLQVRNDIIAQGQLQITGGINVGTGGIFSAGPIGVSIASTTQTDAISAYFQGRVGIATTTPTQKLEVNGGIRLYADTMHQPTSCNSAIDSGTIIHIRDDINGDELRICAASSTNYAWRPL